MTELKQEWIKALRSGSYTQGKSQLRTTKGYCCLGVLCDVVNPHGWRLAGGNAWVFDGNHQICISKELREQAGISNDELSRVMRMNDAENKSFEEIANYLEGK